MEINSNDEYLEIYNKYFSKDKVEKQLFKMINERKILDSKFSFHNGMNKIMASILQSLDIKFGYFLEDLFNLFLKKIPNLILLEEDKKIDSNFVLNDVEYIFEIKKRDNHDSAKWVGQIENLILKYRNSKNKNKKAIIYFIDKDYGIKHHNNYLNYWSKKIGNKDFRVLYGKDIINFTNDFNFTNNQWDLFEKISLEASKKVATEISNFLPSLNLDKNKYNLILNIVNKHSLKDKRDENISRAQKILKEYVSDI